MKGALFITGTGTDVGKTVATGAVLRALRTRGLNTATMKPVQTGADSSGAPDLYLHWEAAEWTPPAGQHRDMAPYLFRHACSPHLAAKETGRTVEIPTIRRAAERLMEAYDLLLIEGAGGLLVPLSEQHTMRDLIVSLECPVLLVAPTGLGTINHTLLTIEALRAKNIPIAGVLYSQLRRPADQDIETDNPGTIALISGVPTLGVLRYRARPNWKAWSREIAGIESIIKLLGAP
jgi:dethiobiotin synthetase